MKLCEIEDMNSVSKYLSDILLNSKITNKNFNLIKSTLNAHFISKIFLLLGGGNKNTEEIYTIF